MARPKKNLDQTIAVPEREMVLNRANAKKIAKGQPVVPKPTLASTRTRRRGTDKAYFDDAPPTDIVRRIPVPAVPVPRLPGQEDIPSSPVHGPQYQNIPGPSHDFAAINLAERTRSETGGDLARTAEPEVGHPFGGTHNTFEPHCQPIPDLSAEDNHILPSSTPQSNSGHHNSWDYFGSNELQDQGVFGMWMGDQTLQPGFALPQSEFAAPQPTFPTPQLNFAAPQSTFVPPQSNTPINSPILSTGSFEQPSHRQQPDPVASPPNNLQHHILDRSAPSVHVLPPGNQHFSYAGRAEQATLELPAAASSSRMPSQAPVSTPVRRTTAPFRSRLPVGNLSKKISSKTPQRKYMKANVAAHYAVQRKHRRRVAQSRQETSQATTVDNEAPPQPNSQVDGLSPDQQAVALAMRKYLGFHILTRVAWPLEQAALLADALNYAKSVPGNEGVGDVEFNRIFTRQLKLKESALRGEFTGAIMSFVQEFYRISPSTRDRIDSLIEGDRFLYLNEAITPRAEAGFFSAQSLPHAVGAFLFQHPHNLGTLFIEELCAEDPPKKWHAKAADRSATNGAPVGLIAFAGVAILHCLECIRDRPPTGKKAYKFEHTRYSHIWVRYRKELIKYKHLGELRRTYLAYIKQRYNEMNRTSQDRNDDSDIDCDDDDCRSNSSSDYASDEPEEGPMYVDLDEGLDNDEL